MFRVASFVIARVWENEHCPLIFTGVLEWQRVTESELNINIFIQGKADVKEAKLKVDVK